MEYAFILEDDPLYRKQIQKALADVNPLIGVKFYNDLEEFYNWLKSLMAEGDRPWAEDDEKEKSRVRLIITRAEFIGAEKLELLVKVKDLFIRKSLCTAEEPVGFVLTAFDDPGFQIQNYQNSIVYNVVFKPFDELILREHLSYALAGRVSPAEFGLAFQEADTVIEMLKTVELESLSDIGFTSRSNKAFEVGYFSKYYGAPFAGDASNFVFARVARCLPHPQNANEFELEFHFFGNDPSQVTNIRKRVRSIRERGVTNERTLPTAKFIDSPNIVIIEPRDPEFESLAGTIRRKIKNATIIRFATVKLFEEELIAPMKSKTAALSNMVHGLELTKDYVVAKFEPQDATIWSEPLKGAALTKYINPIDLKSLGLWIMGSQKEFLVVTQYRGLTGVLKFERQANRIALIEPEPMERVKYLRGRRKVQSHVTAIMLNGRDLDPTNLTGWDNLKKVMQAELDSMPPAFIVAEKPYKETERFALAPHFDDIFIVPVDRGYLLQKLLFRVPGLRIIDEPVTVSERRFTENIKAVSPVEIEEISEAAMTMDYYRSLSPGSYREFILWQPYVLGAPQILGTCYSAEEKKDSKDGAFKIHFVLFGMRDQMLKSIRLWIRENYVASKERASG